MQKLLRIAAILSMIIGSCSVYAAAAEDTSPTAAARPTVFFDKKDMARALYIQGPGFDGWREAPAWTLRSLDTLREGIKSVYETYASIKLNLSDIGVITLGMPGTIEMPDETREISSDIDFRPLYELARNSKYPTDSGGIKNLIKISITIASRVFGANFPGADSTFFDVKDLKANVVLDGPKLDGRKNLPVWILRSREIVNQEIVKAYAALHDKIAITVADIGPIKTDTGEEIAPDADLSSLYVKARFGEIRLNLTIAARVFGAKI